MESIQKNPYILIVIAFAALPILVQVFLLNAYAVNIPYYDDFLWGVTFLNDHQGLDFWGKVQHLFGQHNQHRVFWLRLVIVSITELKGYLDFRTLVLVGNLGFFGLSLLYMRVLAGLKIPVLYLLPIPFIIHDLSTYHNMFVSYGVPNMTVIFFAILCFYWVTSQKRNRIWWGLLVGILGTVTNGSGILILPLALIGLVFLKKPMKVILGFGLVTSSVLLGYFYDYKTDYSELTLTWQTIPYFIEFMAAYLPFAANPIMQVLMVSFLGFAIYKTLSKFPLSSLHTFVLVTTAFLMGSGLLATLFRLIHDIPIPNWYFIYSYAFIGLIYIWLQYTYKDKLLRFGFFMVFMGLSLYAYFHDFNKVVMSIESINSRLLADAENYRNHQDWAYIPLKAGIDQEAQWQRNYDELYKKGLVKLPEKLVSSEEPAFQVSDEVLVKIEANEYLITYEDGNNDGIFESESLAFLVSEDSSKVYYAGKYHYNNSLRQKWSHKKWFNAQGTAVIPQKYSKRGIPEGTYKYGVFLRNKDGKEEWLLADEEIVIENW